jgi:hypothetical protein
MICIVNEKYLQIKRHSSFETTEKARHVIISRIEIEILVFELFIIEINYYYTSLVLLNTIKNIFYTKYKIKTVKN